MASWFVNGGLISGIADKRCWLCLLCLSCSRCLSVWTVGNLVIASTPKAFDGPWFALVLLNLGLVVLSVHFHLVLLCPCLSQRPLRPLDHCHCLFCLYFCISHHGQSLFIHTLLLEALNRHSFSTYGFSIYLILPVAGLFHSLVVVTKFFFWPLGAEFLGDSLASKVSLYCRLDQVPLGAGQVGIHQQVPTLQEIW